MAIVTRYAFLAILTLQMIWFTIHIATSGFRTFVWINRSVGVNYEIPDPISVSISQSNISTTYLFQADIYKNNSRVTLTQVVRENLPKHPLNRVTANGDENNQVCNKSEELVAKTGPNDQLLNSMNHVTVADNNSFQAIDNKSSWLYSAYFYDITGQTGLPAVRVFGVVQVEHLGKVFCYISQGNRQQITTGLLTPFKDGHDKPLLPSYVNCNLTDGFRPTHISISFQSAATPTNKLTVSYPEPKVRRNFTVCYSILHSKYKLDSQLIFSIETNRLLGADHFIVYNNTVAANVERILLQYQRDGLVTILQWPIPTLNSWYYSQMTALNDCFYRSRNISRFVVVLDTDEFIIPRHHSTWIQLMDNVTRGYTNDTKYRNVSILDTKAHDPIGSFMIMSCFFSINSRNWSSENWQSLPSGISVNSEEQKSMIKYKMFWFLELWRSKVVYPFKVRSKYIARPELVDIAGIHYVHIFSNGTKYVNVSGDLALVHHYRKSELLSNLTKVITSNQTTQWKSGILEDISLLKLKNRLYPIVIRKYKQFDDLFP